MMSRTLQSRWQAPDLSAFEAEIQNYLNSPVEALAPKSSARPNARLQSAFGLDLEPEQRMSQELVKLAPSVSKFPQARNGQSQSQGSGGTPRSLEDLDDREILARTIWGEASGEPLKGQHAVTNVVLNRIANGGYGGKSIRDVALSPGQFSMWNGVTGYAKGEGERDPFSLKVPDSIYGLVDKAMSGELPDITGGALNYYNDAVADPKWGAKYGGNFPLRIGNHIFGWAK